MKKMRQCKGVGVKILLYDDGQVVVLWKGVIYAETWTRSRGGSGGSGSTRCGSQRWNHLVLCKVVTVAGAW